MPALTNTAGPLGSDGGEVKNRSDAPSLTSQDSPAQPHTAADWIDHDGGPRPVHPNTLVLVRHRDGKEPLSPIEFARNVQWDHKLLPWDVVAYRVHKRSAEEVAAELRVRDTAPDLLDVLKETQAHLTEYLEAIGEFGPGGRTSKLLTKIHAAIAKAEGRS